MKGGGSKMKKKLKLKSWVKQAMLAITILPILLIVVISLNELDKGFVENCMSNGYSKFYCERSK